MGSVLRSLRRDLGALDGWTVVSPTAHSSRAHCADEIDDHGSDVIKVEEPTEALRFSQTSATTPSPSHPCAKNTHPTHPALESL